MDIVERLRSYRPPYGWPEEYSIIVEPTLNHVAADEIERLRKTLRQITELSPFKFNTGHATLQYITQMLVEMTALAHEALKEKE